MSSQLRHGPLGADVCHIAIDMQVYFAEKSDWASASTFGIVPAVSRLAEHAPERTVFTRFMPPQALEHAAGAWKTYYERWGSVLRQRNSEAIYDLLPALKAFVPPAHVVDKDTYSAFESPRFVQLLERLCCRTLIVSGVETDVCVLATALSAVDRGFRVVLTSDAMASGSDTAHARILDTLVPRFDRQIEVTTSKDILQRWKP